MDRMDDDLNHLELQIEQLIESRKQLKQELAKELETIELLKQEVDSLQLQLVKLNEEFMKAAEDRSSLAQQNQQATAQIQRIIAQLKEEINAA